MEFIWLETLFEFIWLEFWFEIPAWLSVAAETAFKGNANVNSNNTAIIDFRLILPPPCPKFRNSLFGQYLSKNTDYLGMVYKPFDQISKKRPSENSFTNLRGVMELSKWRVYPELFLILN